MNPYTYQKEVIEMKRNRILLAWDCGVGKTFTSLWCMENLDRNTVLILCPIVVFNKWQKDIQALYGDPTVVSVVKKNRYTVLQYTDKEFHVATKEYFTANAVTFLEAGIDGIIIDEAHYFAGIKSKMAKTLYRFIQQFPEADLSVYLLTATDYLSTPWNIYMLGKHLGRDWNYYRWEREFFTKQNMGGRMVPIVRSNAMELLQKYRDDISVRVKIEDVMEDLPDQKVQDINLGLTRSQVEALDKVSEDTAIVEFTKKHQIENGYIPAEPLDNRPEPILLPCKKLDWITNYVKTHPHTAVIARYTAQLHQINDALQQAGFSTAILDGKTKNRDTIISKARSIPNGNKSNAILIQAAVSEGYELPEIEHVIFASLDWSYKNYVQMMGRFLRINAPTPTTFHRLVTGPVDKRVLQAINRKEDFYV